MKKSIMRYFLSSIILLLTISYAFADVKIDATYSTFDGIFPYVSDTSDILYSIFSNHRKLMPSIDGALISNHRIGQTQKVDYQPPKQIAVGVVGGLVGAVGAILLTKALTDCYPEEDEEGLCGIGVAIMGLSSGLPLGTATGVYWMGDDDGLSLLFASIGGAYLGGYGYLMWDRNYHVLPAEVSLVTGMIFTSISAYLAYAGAARWKHRSLAKYIPAVSVRRAGSEAEWIINTKLFDFRF